MNITIVGDELQISKMTAVQYEAIKAWNMTRWDKSKACLRGALTLPLLDKLAQLDKLPEVVEKERLNRRFLAQRINEERSSEDPAPLIAPPVKANLFRHQVRALNMALLTFGWVEP